MAPPIKVSDKTFALVIEGQPLVVADFWAPWCGPCRVLGPVVERLAEEYEGRVTFVKLDVDENPDTAERFLARSIPTLLYFRKGVLVDRTVGAIPEAVLRMKLEQLLKAASSPQAA